MMKKTTKKRALFLVMTIVMVSMLGITAFANTSYNTSISLSSRSTLLGSYRDYVGSTHRIDNKLTWRNWETTGDNYAEFQLEKKTTFSYTVQGTKTLNLKTIDSTYSASYTGQSDGTFRYYIYNTYPMGDYRRDSVDSWSSNQVTMSSK